MSLRVSLAREGLHRCIEKHGGFQGQTSQFGRLSWGLGGLLKKDGVSTVLLANTRANDVHNVMPQPEFPSVNLTKVS